MFKRNIKSNFYGIVLTCSLFALGLITGLTTQPVSAQRYISPSYTIDASVGDSFGGKTGSTSYSLVSAGGETIVGNGQGGSYKLTQGYVAELEKSIQLTVQPSNLKGYYPMEENTGTATFDNSANANNGDLISSPTWTTGKIGQALSFNGTSQYVTIPDSSSLPSGTLMTVSAWVNQTSLTANKAIVSKWKYSATQDGTWAMQTGSTSSTIRVFIASAANDGGSNYCDTPSSSFSTGWHHVTLAYDGGLAGNTARVKIYIDGVAQTLTCSGTIEASILDSNAAVRIGDFEGLNRYWNGEIDEVKIFSRALTDAEVKAEYNAQNTGVRSGLSLNSITPGGSQTANFDAIIQTDGPGYDLSLSQNQNLTSGGNTIPAISGTIESPLTWSEGSTKGLGFTLVSGISVPAKWNSGNSYAAIPGANTAFYSRAGYTAGTKDVLSMRLRADVITSQVAGDYINTATFVGTVTP